MFSKEINSIIKKYGCKGFVVYPSFRKPIDVLLTSLCGKNISKNMSSYGIENNAYFTAITPIAQQNLTDGDTICIGNRLFSVVSTVTHEHNGKGLYRKLLLMEKGESN